MIIDNLTTIATYRTLTPRLNEAIDYITHHDLSTMDDGRYEICGDAIFMTIATDTMRTTQEAFLEAHNRYIDIQMPLSGPEQFGWLDRATCQTPRAAFDQNRDIIFFNDIPSLYFTLRSGQFAVFFPDDAHAPLIGTGVIRKCIIKVMI